MQNKDILLKKLEYQSLHRGCKETDIILGTFAKTHLKLLNNNELLEYEKFLNLDDADIYNWYTINSTLPITFSTNLLNKIRNFSKDPNEKE